MGFFRFLLAVSIIVFHCGPLWSFKFITGHVAVETFFIISGFYMSLILNEKYTVKNKSYRLFLTNRIFRLYPIYWSVLILTCVFYLTIYSVTKGNQFSTISLYKYTNTSSLIFLCLTNLLLVGQDLVAFLGINPDTGNLFFTDNFWITRPQLNMFLFVPQAWTLSIELVFYALAPFILRKKPVLIWGLILFSFLLRLYLYNALRLRYDPWTFRFFPTEIFFFLLGYISYKVYLKISVSNIQSWAALLALGYIVAATVLFEYVSPVKTDRIPFSWNEILFFISVVLLIPILFRYFKDKRFDRWLGDLSYPMYICHYLVIAMLASFPFPIFKETWFITITTVLFSIFLNMIIGNRVEAYRQKRLL
jgi:peptidoglycan/LPS O-acetylase OafA/YrhL